MSAQVPHLYIGGNGEQVSTSAIVGTLTNDILTNNLVSHSSLFDGPVNITGTTQADNSVNFTQSDIVLGETTPGKAHIVIDNDQLILRGNTMSVVAETNFSENVNLGTTNNLTIKMGLVGNPLINLSYFEFTDNLIKLSGTTTINTSNESLDLSVGNANNNTNFKGPLNIGSFSTVSFPPVPVRLPLLIDNVDITGTNVNSLSGNLNTDIVGTLRLNASTPALTEIGNSGGTNNISGTTSVTGNLQINTSAPSGKTVDVQSTTTNVNTNTSSLQPATLNIGSNDCTNTIRGITNINTNGSRTTTIGNSASTTTIIGPFIATGNTTVNTTGNSNTTIGNSSSTTNINGIINIDGNLTLNSTNTSDILVGNIINGFTRIKNKFVADNTASFSTNTTFFGPVDIANFGGSNASISMGNNNGGTTTIVGPLITTGNATVNTTGSSNTTIGNSTGTTTINGPLITTGNATVNTTGNSNTTIGNSIGTGTTTIDGILNINTSANSLITIGNTTNAPRCPGGVRLGTGGLITLNQNFLDVYSTNSFSISGVRSSSGLTTTTNSFTATITVIGRMCYAQISAFSTTANFTNGSFSAIILGNPAFALETGLRPTVRTLVARPTVTISGSSSSSVAMIFLVGDGTFEIYRSDTLNNWAAGGFSFGLARPVVCNWTLGI